MWDLDSSHGLRGNSYQDAPASRDAERHKLHAHAERGNDKKGEVDDKNFMVFFMKNVLLGVSILVLICLIGGFLYSPYLSLQSIDKALEQNNTITLSERVNIPAHRKMVTAIIEGKLKIKKDIERKENQYEAWKTYGDAFKHVGKAVDSLVSPHGFIQLLKGNLDYIQKNKKNTAFQPVFKDAKINFDSLTQAHTLVEHDSGLETKVILKRTGLFTWNIDSLEFPINDMLDLFVKKLTD